MTRTKKLLLMILIGFLMGLVITISEPDLQVLAQQVPSVPNLTLILAVAVGVGIFLAVALLPIVVLFILFTFVSQDINKRNLIKNAVGIVYTYIGLVLFLTGVNVGFMPAGNYLGQTIAFSLPVTDTAGLRLIED